MRERRGFRTRFDAGRALAEELRAYTGSNAVVLGIARGGIAVGRALADELQLPLEPLVPRKIPIPWSPEMGYGAVMPDGTVVLNDRLVRQLNLAREETQRHAQTVLAEVRRRQRVYAGDAEPAPLDGRTAIVVDDGLATGFTMIAALRSVRKREPARLVMAVPAAPLDSLERVRPEADEAVCLVVSRAGSFAVASFYDEFPEMTDDEVIRLLRSRPYCG
jgi:putative phosphoribosyl transferase